MKRYNKIMLLVMAGHAGMASAATTAASASVSAKSSGKAIDNAVSLDTVEVAAESIGRGSDVSKMDISTTVITREEIASRPEIYLDQMINKEMGIWTTQVPANQVDPTAAVVGIRGFGQSNGEKVLVMVDGVPINDGYFKTIDWNMVPRDTIERIEIVRGGGAASLWGNLAMGGMINIITKEPEKGDIHTNFRYGSFQTSAGEVGATLIHEENFKLGVNFNTIVSDGYTTPPSQGQFQMPVNQRNQFITAGHSETYNGLISADYKPWEGAKFYTKLNVSQLNQTGLTYSLAGNQWNKYDYRGGGEIKYSDTGAFNINTFYNYSEMNKQNGGFAFGSYASTYGPLNTRYGNTTGIINQTGIYRNTNANSMVYNTQLEEIPYQTGGGSAFMTDTADFGSWGKIRDIKVGLDLRGTSVMDNNNAYNPNARTGTRPYPGGTYLAANIYNSARNMFEGLFAQGTYTPLDIPLDLTLGLRMDWWQAFNGYNAVSAYNQSGLNTSSGQTQLKDQYFNQFNPRFGFKWTADPGLDFRGAIYRNYAAPGMNQLYRPFISSGSITLANPSLAPESNFGQEIGLDFTKIKDVKVSLTFFHNTLNNYISSGRTCNTSASCAPILSNAGLGSLTGITSVTERLNAGNAIFMGGEAMVVWTPVDPIRLNFGFTGVSAYMNGFNSKFNTINNNAIATQGAPVEVLYSQLGNVQPMTITAGGEWDMYEYAPGLTFNWLIKSWPTYYSSSVHQNYGDATNNPQNVSTKLSAATVGDLALRYQATKQIGFTLSAQNIGNKYYLASVPGNTTGPSSLGMPFNVMGGVEVKW